HRGDAPAVVFLSGGADGRTRTGTACATAPSRQRVYQFHHVGKLHRAPSLVTAALPAAAPRAPHRHPAVHPGPREPAPAGRPVRPRAAIPAAPAAPPVPCPDPSRERPRPCRPRARAS